MNRITAQGLVTEAADGRRVLVVSDRQVEARIALGEVVRAIPKRGGLRATVRYSNGRESVEFPSGGTVLFTTTRALDRWVRGRRFDLVYLDTYEPLSRPALDSLRPAIATGGEVLHS